MAPGLFQDAVAGVGEDEGDVCGRGPGDHVAGVLHVARGVGQNEGAAGGGEVAVGDVDRDALLPLGAQPVGEQGQVEIVAAPQPGGLLDGLQLVLEDLFGVVEQPADECALPVIDRTGGGEADQVDGIH